MKWIMNTRTEMMGRERKTLQGTQDELPRREIIQALENWLDQLEEEAWETRAKVSGEVLVELQAIPPDRPKPTP